MERRFIPRREGAVIDDLEIKPSVTNVVPQLDVAPEEVAPPISSRLRESETFMVTSLRRLRAPDCAASRALAR